MVLGIILVIASVAGIIYGIKNKNMLLAILSMIVLILTIVIGICFYKNPY